MAISAAGLEFRLLGPFEVVSGGRPVNVGGPQVRGVLARLLVDAGLTVSLAALVEELWGDRAPADANRTMRTYVSRLRNTMRRGALGDGREELLIMRPPGYQLAIDPEAVDATRFERLAAAGRRELEAGRPEPAYEQLAAALGLWRGDALAEFDELPTVTGEAARLERMRLTVIEDRVEAALAVGAESRIVDELEGLVHTHPLRERLWGQLMTALYRSGRQAEALAAFGAARAVLVDAFGVEPSPGLTEIQQRILHHDSSLITAPTAGATTAVRLPAPARPRPPAMPIPAQLPLDRRDFTGRADELARLDALLTVGLQPADPGSAAMTIAVLSGTAGVGKTSLALHWAHRVAADFPDGQLYVDLRGFDPGGTALDPADAVRAFLDAFDVPVRRIPTGLAAQVGLYRSLLSGKRLLVVLDNARDAEQARPLLPGSADGFVVVTSRDPLTPLVAAQSAHPLTLELLTAAESRELLARRLGADRVAAEPEAVDQIVARCAGLPLALSVAAARVAVRPGFPLSALAAELCEITTDRLDAFQGGDPGSDVRAVFSWSYRRLSSGAARLFQLLGLHPGPDLSMTAAASLGGIPLSDARPLLAELCRAHLLTEHAPGRYTFHDLLRAYAIELAHGEVPEAARRGAVHRLLDHYLHTAQAVALQLGPCMGDVTLTGPQPGVTLGESLGHHDAVAWFTAEHRVLLCVVEHAHAAGFDRHCWQLAWTCTDFLHRRNQWRDLSAIQHVALSAAQRLGDRTGQAYALLGLGLADRGIGSFDSARVRLLSALDVFEEVGEKSGKSRTHQSLAWIAGATGHHREALDHAQLTLELCRAIGDTSGQATALNNVGWYRAQLGEYLKALHCCHQALHLQQRVADRYGQAHTWDSLGYIHRQRGDFEQAIVCYRRALDLFRQSGDEYSEATALTYLGDAHHDAGDPGAARQAWRLALRGLERLGHPDAERVRGKLDVGQPVGRSR